MNETQLLSGIVRKFSELYPEKRGQFFHVSNERNNQMQAFRAAGMGIFRGLSDLIYFDGFGFGFMCIFGLEVKAPNTRHDRDQIEAQIEWGKILESQGGKWRLIRTIEEAMNFVNRRFEHPCGLTIAQVEQMLLEQKTKTIKF